jgi:hypothetical protein
MLWNSWAKSWGTSWAESWGPLEEQEKQAPHGGGDSSSARLARKAIEEARRKSAQKQIDRDRQVAEEALDALDASRGAAEPIDDAQAIWDKLDATAEGYLPLPEEIKRVEVTLPGVNDLFAKLSPVIIVPADGDNLLPTGNDDEALALIMILAELD